MRIASLGSGSRGNATLVQHGETLLMVDCGFSLRQTEQRMARLQVRPEQLDAILVTHEHSDHCSGVERLSRRYDIPVYMTVGTLASGRCSEVAVLGHFQSECAFQIGDIHVLPVAVPHDAREPCQFVFSCGAQQLGVLTDLGSVTPLVLEAFSACQVLLLECNHDLDMLARGPYPESLKRRVGGDWGHLSNAQAAGLLARLASVPEHLVIAHISDKNNCPEAVSRSLTDVWSGNEPIWADQEAGFDWLECR